MRYWSFGNAGHSIAGRLAGLLSAGTMPQTPLCASMTRHGSDKGNRIAHTYTPFYAALFADLDPHLVFEVGIGSQNPGFPYAMTPGHVCGGSLRGWREFFPGAHIFGADLDAACLIQEDRITCLPVNVFDRASIARLWHAVRQRIGNAPGFDLMLDDAHHSYQANVHFLTESFAMVRPGGWYVVEDIGTAPDNLNRFLAFLGQFGQDAMLIDCPTEHNRRDNCFLVIRRGAPAGASASATD